MSRLSHLDETGAARMVDVSAKPVTERQASAEAIVGLSANAFAMARNGDAPKGDILSTARIAGIQAAKKTAELIPLCHSLPLEAVHVEFEWLGGQSALRIVSRVRTSARTGVEMEALTAAAIAALTVYDMVKAIDRAALIRSIRLLSKSGGKSGTYAATL